MKSFVIRTLLLACLLGLSACSTQSTLGVAQTTGPDPQLPPPERSLIPVVRIAPAVGWQPGEQPIAADGLEVTAFARDLDHPRWLHVLPNGDVLVAESNAPPDSSAIKGLKGVVMKRVMKKAGAAVPSADRITLLRDADGDGIAESRTVFLSGLRSPFGMALVDGSFYVANADSLMQYPYRDGDTVITEPGRLLAGLPQGPGPLNHHWTKSLLASSDGTRLYVGVGSNSNIAEGGMDKEINRAAILEIDRVSGATRVFASGLRNPVGLAWNPDSGALWTVVNERDELGNDLVPDYLTSVRDGGFYGWPYSYFGAHPDPRVAPPPSAGLIASAIVPDYALGPHVAPLGLAFSHGSALPARFASGAFVGLHGSWNRKPPSGYQVIFVPFARGRPSGAPEVVLSGFVTAEGDARGRPVGVAIDGRGGLLVADDVGNAVWRVAAAR
jgi:glucose/arabinose dehydrogenase